MDWISVKERLPEGGQRVLTFGPIYRSVSEMLFIKQPGKNYYYLDGGRLVEPTFITHWMPLPDPPKEAE